MIEYVGFAVAAVAVPVAALFGWAARRPDTFRYERSTTIAAPPERIFPLIDDLRAMNTWNPFASTDPAMLGTYSGPACGRGAAFEFAGRKSGSGRVEVTGSEPPSRVSMRLQMTRPMACDNTVEFTLVPQGRATRVTWAMHGPQPLMARIMTSFIDCDRMCGEQFEKGLADLKAKAEAGAA